MSDKLTIMPNFINKKSETSRKSHVTEKLSKNYNGDKFVELQEKTKIIIPKVGLKKKLIQPTIAKTSNTKQLQYGTEIIPKEQIYNTKEENNPWIVNNNTKKEIKILAVTPIGTVTRVPTSNGKILRQRLNTPANFNYGPVDVSTSFAPSSITNASGNSCQPKLKIRIKNQPDSLLNASIYLDTTNNRDYNYVREKMRSITETTKSISKGFISNLKNLINVSGLVSHDVFETVLSIYENNQVYYQDLLESLDNRDIPATADEINLISDELSKLEWWFMSVIEPKSEDDIDGWCAREIHKIKHKISSYCDQDLYKYIKTPPDNYLLFIINHHKKLKLN